MRHRTPDLRRRLRGAPALLLACALWSAAAPADARPVVAGFAVTPARGHPECDGHATCLHVTLRVFDGSRLKGSILRYRFVARHGDETAFRINAVGEIPNQPGVQHLWIKPETKLRRGTYLARVIVAGASTTKSPVRSFAWR